MTSNAVTPTNLSVSYEGWTNRSYQGPPYGAVGVIDFTSPIEAQHVAVVSENMAAPLLLVEVVITEKRNIAYNKSVAQSTTSGEYRAGRAVNGNYGDFTYTNDSGIKWWRVDLQDKYTIGRIELHNRDRHHEGLSQISMMTSNAVTPTNLSVSYEEWTTRSYQGPPYGAVGVINFTSPIEAQHVAVVSENMAAPLSLAEVVVYEYNYATSATASQSSTYNALYPAEKAIDGDISSFSHTLLVEDQGSQWWMMESKSRYFFQRVVVFVRDGQCGDNPCSSRLTDVYLLTNSKDNSMTPNTNGEGEWNVCYYSPTALGNRFVKSCDQGMPTPVTKRFSIFTQNGRSVELREVMVYGKALPQLPDDLGLRVDHTTYSSIEISFNVWTEDVDGYLPPSSYNVEVSGVGSQSIIHTSNSKRLSYNWTNLIPDTSYTFTIKCRIQDEDCPGPQPKMNATTGNCFAPASFNVSTESQKSMEDDEKKWKIKATWTAPTANCIKELTYEYQVDGQELQTTTSTNVDFYVDGETDYKLMVWAINYQGLRSHASISGRSGSLEEASQRLESSVNSIAVGAGVGTAGMLIAIATIIVCGIKMRRMSNEIRKMSTETRQRSPRETEGGNAIGLRNLAETGAEYVNAGGEYDVVTDVNPYEKTIPENADAEHVYAKPN